MQSWACKETLKLVELVWEHSGLYNWKDPGYTRDGNICLVWKNIGKNLNVSGKILYCWICCNLFRHVM